MRTDDEIIAMLDRIGVIFKHLEEQGLISKDVPENDMRGEIECPTCGKKTEYWQSSYNGHRGLSGCDCLEGSMYQE